MTGGGPFLLIRFATTMEHVVLNALVPTRELASLFREPHVKGFKSTVTAAETGSDAAVVSESVFQSVLVRLLA